MLFLSLTFKRHSRQMLILNLFHSKWNHVSILILMPSQPKPRFVWLLHVLSSSVVSSDFFFSFFESLGEFLRRKCFCSLCWILYGSKTNCCSFMHGDTLLPTFSASSPQTSLVLRWPVICEARRNRLQVLYSEPFLNPLQFFAWLSCHWWTDKKKLGLEVRAQKCSAHQI